MNSRYLNGIAAPVILATWLVVLGAGSASAQQQTSFATAEEAVSALIAALEKNDLAGLGSMLGAGSEDLVSSGDEVADANARAEFVARYHAKHALVPEGEASMTLQVGDNDWPLPIPVVLREGKWFLDGASGAEELVYRRIGRNELGAIAVCRGFVDAQIEYAAVGHDGNDAGVFAAKLVSDPDQQNGLYWPTAEGEPPSPAGEAVARAAAEGYRAITGKRRSYHGYHYRMLYAQGASANGGAREYFVDGLLAQGVALIAWPAAYGTSGVKSFIVNHEGVVHEKDLGEDTAAIVEGIVSFDPDTTWTVVPPDEDS